MKNLITSIPFLIVITLLLFSNVGYAQSQESENFEKIKSKIIKKGNFKSFENPKVTKSDRTFLEPVESNIAKKFEISTGILQFVDNFYKGCYIYRADKSDCGDCTLLWFDRNGDGVIQIKRELRAVCKSTFEACNVEVEKIVGGGACD